MVECMDTPTMSAHQPIVGRCPSNCKGKPIHIHDDQAIRDGHSNRFHTAEGNKSS